MIRHIRSEQSEGRFHINWSSLARTMSIIIKGNWSQESPEHTLRILRISPCQKSRSSHATVSIWPKSASKSKRLWVMLLKVTRNKRNRSRGHSNAPKRCSRRSKRYRGNVWTVKYLQIHRCVCIHFNLILHVWTQLIPASIWETSSCRSDADAKPSASMSKFAKVIEQRIRYYRFARCLLSGRVAYGNTSLQWEWRKK